MGPWLLSRFDELRRELLEAGTFNPWCDELRALVSPDGALSLYEVIDTSNPEHWRQAVERIARGDEAQRGLMAEVEHGR